MTRPPLHAAHVPNGLIQPALKSPRSDFIRLSALKLTSASLKVAAEKMPEDLQGSLATAFAATCSHEYKQKAHTEKALKEGGRIVDLAQARFSTSVSGSMCQAFVHSLEREAADSAKAQATAKRLLDSLSSKGGAGAKKRKAGDKGTGGQKTAKSKSKKRK